MTNYAYVSAASVSEAIEMLSAESSLPLAGGTDLLVQIRRGARTPLLLVDIKGIGDLVDLVCDANGCLMGAAVTCARIRDSAAVHASYPALSEATGLVGGAAIQTRATIGGNLCNAAPSADTIPPLIVYDATCRIVGPDGTRSVPVAEFCTGPGTTVLNHGELLVSVTLPRMPQHSGGAYLRFTPRHEMDIAVAGVAVWLELDGEAVADARVALSAVGPTPVVATEAARAMIGQELNEEVVEAAGNAAAETSRPIDDVRGAADERKRLIATLTRRATRIAAERAMAVDNG